MMSEIKPCPFCGTSMVVLTQNTFSHPGTLGDHRCLLAGKGYYWEHIDWWNTRQSTSDLQAKLDEAVEALKNIRDIEKPPVTALSGDSLNWYITAMQMAELADDALITAA